MVAVAIHYRAVLQVSAYEGDFIVRQTILSSANKQALLLREIGRSFIYTRNEQVLNTDPWPMGLLTWQVLVRTVMFV